MTIIRNLFGDEVREDEEPCVQQNVLNSSRLGRYAEFIVCAELTRLGYYVTHVDAPGFDLILTVENASLRVQVKSTMQTRNGFCVWKCVHRCAVGPGQRLDLQKPITKAQADVLALYHHELRSTVFLPVEGRRIIRLPISQVRNHDAAMSLRAVLDRLYPVVPWEPTASDDDDELA